MYLSDHGEEIYELSNYIGHGSAEHSSDLKYQIRVPFLIWTSKSYSRPEIVERLSSLQHIPITTDDVSHLLIDLAGIQTPGFKPTRSTVNSRYNRNKRRSNRDLSVQCANGGKRRRRRRSSAPWR